ncbi:MAG: ComF family protein [Actinobacteria bacterium]|uniref:Unannotated protein n=1 Tax=freshwater metagenome TaxID=449393 RepID=A0A6J6PHQ3_9ZZZZ|nr:ComF family protein [Actinomycetota bacterium]
MARSAVLYSAVVRSVINAWKERGGRALARAAARIVADEVPHPGVVTLTWVPPDLDRTLRRGHHPARDLTHALAERWDVDAQPMLSRGRGVPRQAGLDATARRRNARGAFTVAHVPITRVVLIDDVFTTGATAGSCAHALHEAGAKHIDVVTFARTVR